MTESEGVMKNYIPELIYETVAVERTAKRKIDPEGLGEIPYDKDAFDCTDIGRSRRELNGLYEVYKECPMHPNVIRYWAERSLKKEVFDNDGKYGFDALHEYSVFTPLDLNPEKKYALIYFCHGGGQPIEWAETYGFNTLAAIEKYIVVYAQNGGRSNDEVDTEFPRVMGEIRKKGYPVDWERVYVAGFSSGSEASAVAACTCPNLAAAIAVMPGGQPFKDLEFYTGSEYYASTKGCRIPGIFIGGTVDPGNFPARWMTEYFGNELGAGTVENAVQNLDVWMKEIAQVQNYEPLTREGITELLLHAEDPVECEFGLKFDRKGTFRAQGTDWLGGEFIGKDGAPVMRILRAKGVPHIIWESQANLVWDFLKHYRRDPQTGESIYDPVVCWGER